MADILYSTAWNHNRELTKAADAQKGELYECLSCDQRLVLKQGKIKRAHFSHKAVSTNCTPESVLHYSFKTLLCEKIHNYLNEGSSFGIEWNCNYCNEVHQGNLLKKVVKCELEYNLGVCRPDIALLAEDGRVVAAIEVVVTHSPEQRALDYYKKNQIALILLSLVTDEDLQRLDSSILKIDELDLCPNPKCTRCGEHQFLRCMTIIQGQCSACFAPIKLAVLGDHATRYQGILNFSLSEVNFANDKGVYLTEQYSRRLRRKYLSTTCRACNFSGASHFLYRDYLSIDSKCERETFNLGYYCPCNDKIPSRRVFTKDFH